MNRSGPPKSNEPWIKSVKWVRGDLNVDTSWEEELKDTKAVISCIGAFGSNQVNTTHISILLFKSISMSTL